MEILSEIPVRDEILGEPQQWQPAASLSATATTATTLNTKKRVSPTSTTTTSDSEMDYIDLLDDAYDGASSSKKRKLALEIHENQFSIDEIKKRPLPREDGRPWEFWQQTKPEEDKRPYGKTYLREQEERYNILSQDPQYHFISELAGALRKQAIELFEEEDMQRALREKEAERLQLELDMRRTRISAAEKYDMIGKLRKLAQTQRDEIAQRKKSAPPSTLSFIAKFLLEHEDLPLSVIKNRYYGFLDLVQEERLYTSGNLISSILNAVEKEENNPIERLLREQIDQDKLVFFDSEEKRELFFYLYVYHRDFLDNETRLIIKDSLVTKLTYLVDHFTEITAKRIVPETVSVKAEPTITSTGGTTTTSTATTPRAMNEYYSREIGKLTSELGLPNVWDNVMNFYREEEGERIKWSFYGNTETIDLFYFQRLKIPLSLEREMAKRGAEEAYGTLYPKYIRNMLLYLYGNEEEKEAIVRGARNDETLNLTSDKLAEGGHPTEIIELIEIQFPDYKRQKPVQEIGELARSHFLWLFFAHTPWINIVELLLPSQKSIVSAIQDVFQQFAAIFSITVTLYKILLVGYLRRVVDYLMNVKTEQGVPPLTLPDNVREALQASLRKDNGETMYLKEDVKLFDQLNQAIKDMQDVDLIVDPLFLRYVLNGKNAFVSRLANTLNPPLEQQQQQQQPFGISTTAAQEALKTVLLPILDEYPILRLHPLFKLYTQYSNEYSLFLENDLTLIEQAIQKATRKLAKLVGDEAVSPVIELDKQADYRQRRGFTTQPINSGFVKLKDEVVTIISRAYHKVQENAVGLCGLPLPGFYCKSAYASGLTSDFVHYIAVVNADNELLYPDSYKSGNQYDSVRQRLQETMLQLKLYSYGINMQPSDNNDAYTIIKNREPSNMKFPLAFSTERFLLNGGGGGGRFTSSSSSISISSGNFLLF